MGQLEDKLKHFLSGGTPDKVALSFYLFAPLEKSKSILELLPLERIKEIPYIWDPAFPQHNYMSRSLRDRKLTVLHIAAMRGFIDECPKEFLTEKALTARDGTGVSVLDYAALHGHLDKVPKDALVKHLDLTAIHRAALNRKLYQVPVELLTDDMVFATQDSKNLLQVAAEGGCLDQLPECHLTDKTMTDVARFDCSPLHIAAEFGTFNNVPKKFFTKANLAAYDIHNRTVAQVAATTGCLSELPFEVVKELMYVYRDDRFREFTSTILNTVPITPAPAFKSNLLHCAASGEMLDNVPKVLITREAMFERNALGNTVLHTAALSGCLSQVPEEFLTCENLLISSQTPSETELNDILEIGGSGTVLEAVAEEDLDCLLAIDLSDECEQYVSPEWWSKYKSIQRSRELLDTEETHEIDLF